MAEREDRWRDEPEQWRRWDDDALRRMEGAEYRREFRGRGYGREYGPYGPADYGRQYGGAYGPGYYGGSYRGGYGREGYGGPDYDEAGRDYGPAHYGGYRVGYGPPYGGEDRGWFGRTTDEVASWFGDEEAARRRELDERYGPYRGRGPKGYRRSDERIGEDIHDRLTDDPWLDASEIEVRVENGEVTLDGTVDARPDKRRAEDVAETVLGVTHVQNNLRPRAYGAMTGESVAATEPRGGEGGAKKTAGRRRR